MLFPKQQKGFTLVEMIVSLGIFAVVAVIALGALVKIITANKKAQTLQAAMTNLNAALDAMSRELRVGTAYHCDTTARNYDGQTGQPNSFSLLGCAVGHNAYNSPGSFTTLGFLSSRSKSNILTGVTCNLATVYRFVNTNGRLRLQRVEQSTCGTAVGDTILSAANNDIYDMLSSTITLDDYRIGVNTDTSYPYVYIRLIGHAGIKEKEKTYFDVQTTVSSRVPQS